MLSSLLLLLPFLVLEVLLKLIEAFVPEPLVLMHPSRDLPKWFRSKRNEDFATLFPALNESSSLEKLQMFRHRVEGSVERLCDFKESSRPTGELADDRTPSRVGNGGQNGAESIHDICYTKRCNVARGSCSRWGQSNLWSHFPRPICFMKSALSQNSHS